MEDRTLLSSFLVNTTADSGPGSLRQAILDSNAATGGTNTIDFDIPGQGVQTIAPASPLPAIANPVLIDGFSQPGYDGSPLIELDGSQDGTGDGLTITGPDVTVRGLDINNFSQGASIHITGTAATGDWIYGNDLGTDPTGTQATPNDYGIEIDSGASNNLVGTIGDGDNDLSEPNLIGGNTFAGVEITGQGTEGNSVAGNLIGTTVTGDTALPNGENAYFGYYGYRLASGGGVVIGGYAYGNLVSDNVISGNNNFGVELSGNGTSGNVVQGNMIGTDLTGTLDLGNSSVGIEVDTGASDNTIGGTNASAGNLITNNGGPGVVVGNSVNDTTVGDQITSNRIFGNQGQAIDLGDLGVIDNASSPQQGPNNLQNFPITVTTTDGSLQGWLGGSTPDTTFRIDIFASAEYGPGGAGEAEDDLGSLEVTTDATGQVSFAVPFAAPASLPIVTATATDPLGNTSELSAVRQGTLQAPTQPLLMVPGGPLVFSTASGTGIELLDPDAGPLDPEWNLTLSVSVGTLTVASTAGLTGSGDGSGSLSGSGPLSDLNAALEGLEFTPPPGFHGNTTLSLNAASEGASPLQAQLLITDGLFSVTTTADSGPGSLRQAILDSNAATTGSTNIIDFDIPGQGVQTIAPASPLPAITNPVLIDGFSQPGYDGTPLIELSGSQAGLSDGLLIAGPDVTVRGLDINSFSQGAGIELSGTAATGDWIDGNFLGTDPTGTQAAPNVFGVAIDFGASNNLVGTNGDGANDPSERNLISGNTFSGVWIYNSDGNSIADNLIGTTVTGDTALPNNGRNSYYSHGSVYGYYYPGLAGGVEIDSAYGYASGNVVSDNVISGNNNLGVKLSGGGTIGNIVQGNLIGTDLTGTLDLGNNSGGIEVDIGASDNTIGGTNAGAGNLITNNGGPGVIVGNSVTDTTVGDQITSNRIFGNEGQAIDLGDDGVTDNASSPQQGPNSLQNFPLILTGADGSLQGWLGGSTPDTTFRIDVFASADYGPGGAGEAQDYLGSLEVTTDSTGQVSFAVPFTAPAGLPIVTATATDPQGNTSEVSAVRRDTVQASTQLLRVVPGGPLVFSTASGNGIELLDPDAGPFDPEWNLALSVSVGTLTLASTAGLTGSGDGSGSLSYSGPLSAINAALEGLEYTSPPPGSQGFATLSLSATSEGAAPLQSQLNITDGIFSVTTTADSGPGSFRQAILDSNLDTTSGTNTIDFDIPGPGVETIDLASPLPPITTSVLIDGTTQPGFAGTPLIAFGNPSPGSPGPFTISGGDVTIRGLAVDSVTIDATSAGFLIADLHSQGQSNQLSLLNTPGQVVVHSDGLSAADTDAAIAEHLAGGDYSLDGDSTGGPGTAIWTILLTPTSASFQAIPVGAKPSAIVAGDFTGNGQLDLAIANSGDDTVSVLLGNGDGTFEPQVTYAVGSDPDAIVAGDFTGDGHLDLAVANGGDDTVSVLLGNGDGTFEPQVTYAVGSVPDAIVAGDFTGDGHLDLAVANSGDITVSVLLGNGDGTFEPQVTYAVRSDPDAIVAGDFTGNGRLDLAVANYFDNTVSVLLGNGNGTFQPQITYTVGYYPDAIVAGDFTGNGQLDLAVANGGDDTVSVLLGNGDGTFQPQVTYAVGLDPGAIVAGDFTGDGHLDLAVANGGEDTVSVLLGNGDGTFEPQVTYAVGSSPDGIVAGDFTGNGRLDLAVANSGDNTVSVLLGNGDGTFQSQVIQPRVTYAVGPTPMRSWRVTSPAMAGSTSPSPMVETTRCRCCWATATAPSSPRSPTRWGQTPMRSWRVTSMVTAISTSPSPTLETAR